MQTRPDFTFSHADLSFTPRSERGFRFLEAEFSMLSADLTETDREDILTRAERNGLVVGHENNAFGFVVSP